MTNLLSLLHRLSVGNWRIIDDEWIESSREDYDWRPLVVLVLVCVALTLQEYAGDRATYARLFSQRRGSEFFALEGHAWWALFRVVGYVLIPVVGIWALRGERVRDYFISFRGLTKHLWIYVLLFMLVLPFVIGAAQFDSFVHIYPFYKQATRSYVDFMAWEVLYMVQFLALEFFFRGFMLKALAPRMGSQAIFVMVVPYCMIHFGKAPAETLGAIVAGIVLGTLALRTRSIWGGVVIHCAVAVTMDGMAMSRMPKTLWPQ